MTSIDGARSTGASRPDSPDTTEGTADSRVARDGPEDGGAAPAASTTSATTAESLARSRTSAESLAAGPTTAETLGDGRAASVGADEPEPTPVERVGAALEPVPSGLSVASTGVVATGRNTLVANPELSVAWESTQSAWTGKGGFTEGARNVLEDAGMEVGARTHPTPAGSIGPGAGPTASQVSTHNGDLARDAVADRYRAQGLNPEIEVRYDAALNEVPPSIRRSNLAGDRNVDVRVALPHPSDPRLDRVVEIESKAFRVNAGSIDAAQLAHDGARLARNDALRGAGFALENVGRVARPVGVVLDAVDVASAYRADGNRIGENTGRSVSGLVGGGAVGWGGAAAGAAIGTAILPGVGTVVGGVIGAAAGAWAGDSLGRGMFDTVRGWFG